MNTHDDGPRTQSRNAGSVAANKLALCADPWSQTLQLLDRLCAKPPCADAMNPADAARGPRAGRPRRDDGRSRNGRANRETTREAPGAAVITLLERLSPKSVALRWCSASCHYGYQVWVCAKARRAGVCAMSGKAIRRGDMVYRPYTRTPLVPVNVNAMIHFSALVCEHN